MPKPVAMSAGLIKVREIQPFGNKNWNLNIVGNVITK